MPTFAQPAASQAYMSSIELVGAGEGQERCALRSDRPKPPRINRLRFVGPTRVGLSHKCREITDGLVPRRSVATEIRLIRSNNKMTQTA